MAGDLVRRVAAAQATADRFRGQPFQLGKWDCGRLFAHHARAMGHSVPCLGVYSTAVGAKRVLRRLGFETSSALLDSLFPRIAPAEAIAGDLMAADGEQGIDAVMLALGNGMALGWHEDAEGAVNIRVERATGAWRL